jgi:hypothetical protein
MLLTRYCKICGKKRRFYRGDKIPKVESCICGVKSIENSPNPIFEVWSRAKADVPDGIVWVYEEILA